MVVGLAVDGTSWRQRQDDDGDVNVDDNAAKHEPPLTITRWHGYGHVVKQPPAVKTIKRTVDIPTKTA